MSANAIRRRSVSAPVYGLVVDQLKRDPDLKACVDTWKTWRGDRDDSRPAARGQVTLDLFPVPGAQTWETDDSQQQTLEIQVGMVIESLDATLLMDLWWLVQRALYPADAAKRLAFQKSLTDAGTVTPEPDFSALDPNEMAISESGEISAMGRISLAVRQPLNV